MSNDMVVEMRACLVPRVAAKREHDWDWPTFSLEDIRLELQNLGYQPFDVQRLRDILTAYAALLERSEASVSRPYQTCQTCGFSAQHHESCRDPKFGELRVPQRELV